MKKRYRKLSSVNCPPHMVTEVEVTLIAGKETVAEPWIWRLSRDFNAKVTIKKASVDEDYGWMLVGLEGPVEEIQRAIAWLMTTGMHVETQQRAVGA
jgi:L-aspartate semialdehyde sulfurtransferase ferredoxin